MQQAPSANVDALAFTVKHQMFSISLMLEVRSKPACLLLIPSDSLPSPIQAIGVNSPPPKWANIGSMGREGEGMA